MVQSVYYYMVYTFSSKERKGIRFQFRNLLSVRLLFETCVRITSRQRGALIETSMGDIERVFFSVLQSYVPWKSFIERYGITDW